LRDIQERASRAESEFKTREEQVRLLRESGAISELESLRRLATAREESARSPKRRVLRLQVPRNWGSAPRRLLNPSRPDFKRV
jgi:hypothetical protein